MNIKKILREFYPQAFKELSDEKIQELPLSQETVFLSEKNWQSIQDIVKSFYQLKEDFFYQQLISKNIPEIAKKNSQQNSPLMAYDFHIQNSSSKPQENSNKIYHDSAKGGSNKVQEGSVKLIEVNTNASAFLMAHLLYQSSSEDFESSVEIPAFAGMTGTGRTEIGRTGAGRTETKKTGAGMTREGTERAGAKTKGTKNSLKALKKAFLAEWKLFNPHKKTPKMILIDEEIEKQKMRLEFFMYQDFFKSMGWDLEILESKSLSIDEKAFLYTPGQKKIDFIYNRSTDFYFEKHPKLKQAYQKKTCLILPQPRDYALLSDKKRLLDWQNLDHLQPIKKHLLKIKVFNKENKEELWKDRKKYFFKIQQGYGGKLAYRGSSLSHKKAEELLNYGSLAQEYCPPSTLIDSQGQKWKVDLRAYAYKDQVQQLIARIYQGQLTNFKVKGSGFARVKINS